MTGQAGGDFIRVPRSLIEDSPQLAKKIQDFEDLQRKAQEAATVLGDINEIGSIKAQAKQAREEADTALAEALEKSNATEENAKNVAFKKIASAQETAAVMIAEADAKLAVAGGKLAEANEVSAAAQEEALLVRSIQNDVDAKGTSLQQKADALASREQELKGEFEKLAEVRGLIDNVLA